MKNFLKLYLFLCLSFSAFGQEESFLSAGGWQVSGRNELSLDNYNIRGDKTQSFLQNEGLFYTNHLNVSLNREEDSGRLTSIDFEGISADNDLLQNDGLFFLGHLGIKVEDGNAKTPYRLGLGDFFADFTRRTLTRNLKGISIELQPTQHNSLLLVSGSGETRWNDIGANDTWFHGANYLSTQRWSDLEGQFSFSGIYARRSDQSAVSSTTNSQDQLILGGTGKLETSSGLGLKTEYAHIQNKNETIDDTDASSYHLKLYGEHGRFNWSTAWEQNERNYKPAGAVGVIANRRLTQILTRYKLSEDRSSNVNLDLSLIEDGIQGVSPEIENKSVGIGFETRPFSGHETLLTQLNFLYSDFDSSDNSTNRVLDKWSFRVADQFKNGINVDAQTSYAKNSDTLQTANDTNLFTARGSAGKSFALAAARAVKIDLSSGIFYTRQSKNFKSKNMGPTLNTKISWKSHLIKVRIDFIENDFIDSVTTDVSTYQVEANYSLNLFPHEIHLVYSNHERKPDIGQETTTDRFGLRYVYYF